MNRKLSRVVIWSAVVVLGTAGSAVARLIEAIKVKGKVGSLVCRHSEAIVCDGGFPGTLQTDIFVSGEQFVTRSNTFPREATNNLFATVIESNSCTDESSGRFGSLPKAARQNGLQSADLRGTIPLLDAEDGTPAGTLRVDVEMRGVGATTTTKTKDRFAFETPDGKTTVITTTFRGKTRLATAEGPLFLDGNLVDCTFDDETLQDLEQGSRTVERR